LIVVLFRVGDSADGRERDMRARTRTAVRIVFDALGAPLKGAPEATTLAGCGQATRP
jgi:hypothetical protein